MDDDTFTNIDRLTAQVARLKGQLEATEIANRLAAKERDEARKDAKYFEESRDAWERRYWQRSDAEAEARAGLRDRIAVLEDALHDFAANYDCDEGVPVCRVCKAKAVLETPAAKEHCPRRLMGEELPPHMPCDTGDHSKDYARDETIGRLQGALTASENERDHLKKSIAITDKNFRALQTDRDSLRVVNDGIRDQLSDEQERVRVLESALEAIDKHNRRHEDAMNSANEYTRAIRIAVIEALTPAPPAETPAPTEDWRQRHAEATTQLVTCDRQIDRLRAVIEGLRAELAAEKKRADEAEAKLRTFLSEETRLVCEDLRREEAAHAATTAKLGRAVAALQATANRLGCRVGLRDDCKVANGRQCYGCETLDVFDAILADADGTQAAEAWRRNYDGCTEDYMNELEAVYEAAKAYKTMHALTLSEARRWDNSATGQALTDALAAVDARRGAVKP
jgi:hypothetical protein